MFQISTQVKYTHIYKKAAIFFHETKYMTFIHISSTHFYAYTYLIVGSHVSKSIGFKVVEKRAIFGNDNLISTIISTTNYFSHFMLSVISHFNH